MSDIIRISTTQKLNLYLPEFVTKKNKSKWNLQILLQLNIYENLG